MDRARMYNGISFCDNIQILFSIYIDKQNGQLTIKNVLI